MRGRRACGLNRGGDSAGGGDVIVFNENPVEEAEAMIARAADFNRVLLQEPQAGRGFRACPG